MNDSRTRLVVVIREFVAEHSGRAVADVPDFADDHDLFENGDLDSFGFVELLSMLGDRTGAAIDLSDVDPAELATVGMLVQHFAEGADD